MMRKIISLSAVIFFTAASIGLAEVPASFQLKPGSTPQEIIKCTDDLMRGESSQGKSELIVITPNWTRHRYFSFWNVGYEKSYVRITDPEIEKGTGSLRIGFNFWHYVAKAERTIKLSPSLMLQPWIGSDFTNDDLVKMSSISRDYHQELVGEETIDGFKAYKIKLVPDPKAPVVWGGAMAWVRKEGTCIPLKVEYYDEDGELVRTLTYSEIQVMDDREIPAAMTMQYVHRPDQKSILRILSIDYGISIDDKTFTIENLENQGEAAW